MTDMRRYMDIAGAAPAAAPAADLPDMEMGFDEFGPTVPMGAPKASMAAAPVVPSAAPESPPPAPAFTAAVVTDDANDGMQDQAKKVLAKIAHIVRHLAPVMLKGSIPVEPWMLEKLSAAGEALEAVCEYTIDSDAILVMISEGEQPKAKKKSK